MKPCTSISNTISVLTLLIGVEVAVILKSDQNIKQTLRLSCL